MNRYFLYGRVFLGLRLAWNTIVLHPTRTLLSLLGVMIGVLSVVIVMLLGNGVKDFILNKEKVLDQILFKLK